MDEMQLKEFLVERVKNHWKSSKNMLFLADIPTELRDHKQLNYRDILNDKRLKAFVMETEGEDGYRLVQHPSQKANLGLVPYDAEFTFPDGNGEEKTTPKSKKHLPHNARRTTLDFLAVLNSLSNAEQEAISIPTKIIAKLLSER